jgi:hypothetical protein
MCLAELLMTTVREIVLDPASNQARRTAMTVPSNRTRAICVCRIGRTKPPEQS